LFVAYPDTLEVLGLLRERGIRLALLSNGGLPSIGRTLHHAGIEPSWFEALMRTATLGVKKPHPQAYRATAAALGLPAEACAFVDDSAENVAAARAVGMIGWVLDRKGGGKGQDGRIGSLAELAVAGFRWRCRGNCHEENS
jgi:putative hydrolase of the HAD superfamily